MANANLSEEWNERLQPLFDNPEMLSLREFLKEEKRQRKEIFPPKELTFQTFQLTPFEKIKVIILGQDPYHGKGQANGLCFSVPSSMPVPPSLRNIFQELQTDLGIHRSNTDLSDWGEQGVLLLNSVLTVEKQRPASHANRGWEFFTDRIIKMIAEQKKNCVFILWGAYAQGKREFINPESHLVLTSPHPSPFSADRGFFGSRPFSQTNAFLQANSQDPINWG